jgi:hypothetical protein
MVDIFVYDWDGNYLGNGQAESLPHSFRHGERMFFRQAESPIYREDVLAHPFESPELPDLTSAVTPPPDIVNAWIVTGKVQE